MIKEERLQRREEMWQRMYSVEGRQRYKLVSVELDARERCENEYGSVDDDIEWAKTVLAEPWEPLIHIDASKEEKKQMRAEAKEILKKAGISI